MMTICRNTINAQSSLEIIISLWNNHSWSDRHQNQPRWLSQMSTLTSGNSCWAKHKSQKHVDYSILYIRCWWELLRAALLRPGPRLTNGSDWLWQLSVSCIVGKLPRLWSSNTDTHACYLLSWSLDLPTWLPLPHCYNLKFESMSKTKSKNTKSSSIGKENIGMLANWHSNEIYSRLKSLPFP